MKVLIPIVIGLLVVGCGKEKQSTNTNEGNNTPEKSTNKKIEKEIPSKGNGNNSSTANPVKELTINDVVGRWDGGALIAIFNEDGTVEALSDGKTVDTGTWSIKDGKVHTVNTGKFGQRGRVVIYAMNNAGNLQHPFGRVVFKKIK